jgi:hypothetical protein
MFDLPFYALRAQTLRSLRTRQPGFVAANLTGCRSLYLYSDAAETEVSCIVYTRPCNIITKIPQVPPSANRVYAVARQNEFLFGWLALQLYAPPSGILELHHRRYRFMAGSPSLTP